MRKGIHPKYKEITITCGGCGAVIKTRSTRGNYRVDVCSSCHPFYTGRQKYVDSAGRVEKFHRKWGAVMAGQAAGKDKKGAAGEPDAGTAPDTPKPDAPKAEAPNPEAPKAGTEGAKPAAEAAPSTPAVPPPATQEPGK